jgi:N6-L-threonylcarbamoyladenine synthase
MNNSKIILAIESSTDETAAAVLEMTDKKKWPHIKILSSVVKSQITLHKNMGGVVPEVAARAHVKNILPVTDKALTNAKIKLADIDYLAVTSGPGLIPSLIVGVEFAKALSFSSGKPMIPVNHMLGHLYSPIGKIRDLEPASPNTASQGGLKIQDVFPMIGLIVSGGHTMIVLMKNVRDYKVLGQTVDDAAGEAFDKVAKMLKLPYPGGPVVSKLAEKGKPDFEFPRPMINSKNYDFSFSGLKTAVLYRMRDFPKTKPNDLCKAFQDAAVDVLVTKTMSAVKEFGAKSVSLSGGVAANTALRQGLIVNCKLLKVNFFVPPKNLCTDNAEMIGLAAAFMLHNRKKPQSYDKIFANSNLEL